MNVAFQDYYLSKIYFEEGKKEQALKHINEAIEYTNKLYLKKDPYREVFGQIYYSFEFLQTKTRKITNYNKLFKNKQIILFAFFFIKKALEFKSRALLFLFLQFILLVSLHLLS